MPSLETEAKPESEASEKASLFPGRVLLKRRGRKVEEASQPLPELSTQLVRPGDEAQSPRELGADGLRHSEATMFETNLETQVGQTMRRTKLGLLLINLQVTFQDGPEGVEQVSIGTYQKDIIQVDVS